MPNPTPAAQVAALAELFGITPETHRWLAKKDYVYPNGCGHGNPRHLVGVRLDVSKLPDPLGPDADGVWLAPGIAWVWDRMDWQSEGCDLYRTDTGGYGFVLNPPENHQGIIEANQIGSTGTEALLMTCLAARVPEVCAILEVNHA